ncbi:MAG: putative anti-sigma-YlaC factor YlaD [Zhongshania sp.]|jgi:predicted anti-sigma-YlaC factor YlaD
MLNCQQFTDLTSDYIDAEYTGWKRFEVRLHLIICRHCRRFNRHLKHSRSTAATIATPLWKSTPPSTEMVYTKMLDKIKPS